MATSIKLEISKTMPTNITSSMAMSSDYQHFATLTRQLSTTSSQWIYRLDYYDAATQSKLETVDVYNTYNTDKHFLTFIPQPSKRNLIAVATINNLIFYRTTPIQKVKTLLHKQPNVYDLRASPDGQLTVLVGQTIMIYRTIGFKEIVFPQIVENARYCDFSSDGLYMVIASTSSLNLYTYHRLNDNYQFNQVSLTSSQAPVEYGAITSVEFNPSNSSELLVGYLSSSPGFFSLESGSFFKKYSDIQPMSSQNAKIARYMPDDSRVYSYDYLNGVGIWPGLNNKLYYHEGFLLYGATSNSLGTQLIGYVWQQIKVADILLGCPSGKEERFLLQCDCPANQAWNYTQYSCVGLVCLQAEYATGVIRQNACECIQGFKWDQVKQKCAIDCSKIDKALTAQPNLYQCYCGDNWSWNAFTRSCQFDCTQVPYSTGILTDATTCACLPGFVWNSDLSQCECPAYMSPSGSICLCYSGYTLSDSGVCVADCSVLSNAEGPSLSNPQECACRSGYYFKVRESTAGCQLNCSAIKDTTQQYDFSTCLCREHMDWLSSTCVVDCKVIDYSDSVGLPNNTCACAINYHWRDTIKECARSCEGFKYIDPNGEPTLRACPCIAHFQWSQTNTRCEIQCTKIANSEQYSLSELNKCECRPGFVWNQTHFKCQVDCDSIWNSVGRVDNNDTYCLCKDDMPFNSTSLTCTSATTAGVFSSTLSIVGLVIGCVVALIIMVILVRFCWSFSTEKNEEHEKKIKGREEKKKKKNKRMVRQEKAPAMQEEEPKTDGRFLSPNKVQTATSL